jgi:hypothetical protein
MTCERVSELLTLYVDEGLPARDTGRVAGHLARCAACRADLRALEQTLAALDRVRPQEPPIDLWEQFRSRLEAEQARTPAVSRLSALGSRFSARWMETGRLAAWPITPPRAESREPRAAIPWKGALAAPAAVLAAALVGLAGFAIGIRSGGHLNASVVAQISTSRPASPLHAARPRGRLSASATRPLLPVELAKLPLIMPILSPEADRTGSGVGQETPLKPHPAPRKLTVPAPAAGAERGSAREQIAAIPPVAPSGRAAGSADLAEALQSSVEETTRQRVADEVAVLAQALNQAEAHTTDFFGPTGSGEPS